MKLKTLILLVLAIPFVIFSCKIFKDKTNTPEFVSQVFLEHIQKLEFEEAKEYSTEETKMMLTFFTNITELVPDSQRIPAQETDVVIHNCIIQGETAQCSYTANGKNQTIDLIKQEGKWLVDMKKENAKPDYFKKEE
ncbi:MAG: hypothetical protein C0592_08455 [Marinilabiliales bacterium]|nr:MAG: hypothetical protein C0592_08455 [Marinilabiliales bacterium]